MSLPLPTPRRSWPGLLLNFAVALIVLALAGGMFVLSYPGMHALALEAGVSTGLARFYPALFDAVLVVACVAAVVLRDARWWARCFAWLVIVVVLAGIGGTDVVHAVQYALPRRRTEAAVAVAPLVAVLLAFSLLLTMLRSRHPVTGKYPPAQTSAALPAEIAEHPAVVLVAPSTASTAKPPSVAAGPPSVVTAEAASVSIAEPAAPASAAPAVVEEHPPTLPVEALATLAGADIEPEQVPAVAEKLTEDGTPRRSPASVIDEDAPPFATAPFATVPRLNRVRATPTPPDDDEDD